MGKHRKHRTRLGTVVDDKHVHDYQLEAWCVGGKDEYVVETYYCRKPDCDCPTRIEIARR